MRSSRQAGAADAGRRLYAGLIICGVVLAAVGAMLLWRRPPSPQTRSAAHVPDAAPQGAGRAPEPDLREEVWFEEVASQCGIDFRHVSGFAGRYYFPEIMAGGVGLIDYDRDGDLDVYLVQGGSVLDAATGNRGDASGNRLFRNSGNGTFEDVTTTANVGDTGYGMGCTCGDFDNDGWPDIYVTNVGPNALLRNNGDGTFVDVTSQAGVGDPSFSSSAAFVDYDHDGDLDLFVVNYVRWSRERELECSDVAGRPDYCSPQSYNAPAPDVLYQNNGDGTFTDVSVASGISAVYGNGLGVVCADLNGDGLIDVSVANDLTANQLWINKGDGTFRDRALERGMAYNGEGLAEAGMGIDARDVDADGDLDLFMTHLLNQTNTFYINEGEFFVDRTVRLKLSGSLPFTGFGTALIDLNNDGLLDIYVANGRVAHGGSKYETDDPFAEPNQLFEGQSGGTFREVIPRGGTAQPLIHSSRGAAFGDYDNDGDVDIFVVNRDAPVYVLRNRAGSNNHWIMFRVTNGRGRDAIGARVEIEVNGRKLARDVRCAYSYCSSNDPRVHFGLGKASRVDSVSVTWVNGAVETFGPFDADQIVELTQGRGSGE